MANIIAGGKDVPVTSNEEKYYEDVTKAQGFDEKLQGRSVEVIQHHGEMVQKVVATKNENEKWGKLPTVLGLGFAGVVSTALTLGLANLSKDYRKAIWGGIEKSVKSDDNFIGTKTKRLAAGLVTTVGGLGIPLVSKTYRDMTWNPVVHDKAEETIYFSSNKTELTPEKKRELGYDPTDKKDIARFLQERKAAEDINVRIIDGYIVYKEDKRLKGKAGVSSFLMMPDTNNADAIKNGEGAKSIKYWSTKTGAAIEDTTSQWQAINTILAAQKAIKEGWHKECEAMVTARFKQETPDADELKNKLESDEFVNAVKALKKKKKITVISAKDGHARVYGEVNHNKTNINSSGTGTFIPFEDGLKKKINTIYDKNLTEHKKELSGNPIAPSKSDKGSGNNGSNGGGSRRTIDKNGNLGGSGRFEEEDDSEEFDPNQSQFKGHAGNLFGGQNSNNPNGSGYTSFEPFDDNN